MFNVLMTFENCFESHEKRYEGHFNINQEKECDKN